MTFVVKKLMYWHILLSLCLKCGRIDAIINIRKVVITMRIYKFDTYEQASKKAAEVMAAQIILKSDTILGLATGSTPLGAYGFLADWCGQGIVDFSNVKTFNLDEYCGLKGDHPQSYRYFMDTNLFNKVNIKKENTHVPNGLAEDFALAGAQYDADIEAEGGITLQLLGIGNNGHIGFNEPDDVFTSATHMVELGDSTIDANSRFFEKREDVPTKAFTMGMKSIMNAKRILLVVAGKNKMDILNKALYGPITPQVPASILQLHPDVTVVYTEDEMTK